MLPLLPRPFLRSAGGTRAPLHSLPEQTGMRVDELAARHLGYNGDERVKNNTEMHEGKQWGEVSFSTYLHPQGAFPF